MPDPRPDDHETERLLRALTVAMAPAELDPPTASIHAVRRAARERQERLARGGRVVWRRRVALVTSMATALVVGGGSVAWARPVLPTPLRAAARAVGLPVDSQQVADVRSDTVELQRAIGRQDAAGVEHDLANLTRSSARLAPAEWTQLAPRIDELERQAEAFTAPRNPEPTQAPPSNARPSVTEPEHQPDAGPVPTTTDDGRRDGAEAGATGSSSSGAGSSAGGESSTGTATSGSDGSSTPTTSTSEPSGTATAESDGSSTSPPPSGSDGSGGPTTTVRPPDSPSGSQPDS